MGSEMCIRDSSNGLSPMAAMTRPSTRLARNVLIVQTLAPATSQTLQVNTKATAIAIIEVVTTCDSGGVSIALE